jgi:hypothetical protein
MFINSLDMLQDAIIETYNAVSLSSAQAGQQYLDPSRQLLLLSMDLVSCNRGLDSTVHNGVVKVTLDSLQITR